MKIISLNEAVRAMTSTLQGLVNTSPGGEIISLHTPSPAASGCILADPAQLRRLVVHLISNARESVKEGGTIFVETSSSTVTEEFSASFMGAPARTYCVLAVSDTGSGTDSETCADLAAARTVAREMGGYFISHGASGLGTTIRVLIPEADPLLNARKNGEEIILLVEADKSLRSYLRGFLTARGYEILDAANEIDAVELARRWQAPIELLLTDVLIPEIAQIRPAIKVLPVEKPFSPDELLRHVQTTLQAQI